jgi:hypothetical protein
MDTMRLAQTLAGNWIVTLANPEEDGWETQLAEFETTATMDGSPACVALEKAAALAASVLLETFPDDQLRVTSHDSGAAERMRTILTAVGVPAHRME